jgi:hypothetical protein
MLNKNLILIFIIGLLFALTPFINAQEDLTEKKESKMTTQDDDMQKCMNKIAADSTMRMQMMNMMITKCRDDKKGMMQMCKTMMDKPEMHGMMMKMMMDNKGTMKGGMMDHKMMSDSTKTMKQ